MRTNDVPSVLLLDYHDACIYNTDLALLENNKAWLNDACINFQMTRQQQQQQQRESESSAAVNNNTKLICFDPNIVSFFMHQLSLEDEDDTEEMINLCRTWGIKHQQPRKKEETDGSACSSSSSSSSMIMMLIPINDNHGGSHMDFQRPGSGSHWSLLVCCNIRNGDDDDDDDSLDCCRYFHFDSSSGSNANTAIRVATKLNNMISLCQNQSDTNRNGNDVKHGDEMKIDVIECLTPQQINGYDCGVCTLCAAQAIQNALHHQSSSSSSSSSPSVFSKSTASDIKKWLEEEVDKFSRHYENTNEMSKHMRETIVKDIQLLLKES